MTEHTPGPWAHKDGYVFSGPDDERRQNVAVCINRTDEAANAALIVMSPELLKYSGQLVRVYCPTVCGYREHTQICEGARAAIAKAKGEVR